MDGHVPPSSRTALVAGATGLVGRALLPLLLADPRYRTVHVLLRRAVPDLPADPRLARHVVDFATTSLALPSVDDLYIALGTTIKVAGSEAAFRAVDFELVVDIARTARAGGATRLAVVSALGADPDSSVFYNRVKGAVEAAVSALGYDVVVIARPSLLLGDRATLGQPERSGEVWATRLLAPVAWIVPKRVRPIEAGAVASALHAAMSAAQPGVRRLSSATMQSRGLE